jgi:DNA-binding transcriptional LysR family regulator
MAPPDSGFELRHLRYFVAVAEELHFGRAARTLNISQPPLSRQIQDLERNLGAQLLDRSGKSVTLTAAGKVFLAESKRILDQVYRSVETARRAATGAPERLEVGFSAFFDLQLLPSFRQVLAQRCGDGQVTFHRLTTAEQLRLLRSGALDVGLLMPPVENADHLDIEDLFRLPAVALLADTHPLAARGQLSLRDIARESIVDVWDDFAPLPYGHVDRISRICAVRLRVERHVPNLECLFEEVRETGAVALLPSCACQLAGSGFRCVPIAERDADFTFGVAHDRDRERRLLNQFLAAAREVNLYRLCGPDGVNRHVAMAC